MEIDTLEIAKITHHVNTNYRIAIGEDPGVPWHNLDGDKQVSIMKGVDLMIEGLQRGEPPHPATMHENWCRDTAKIDPDHPNLVEYNELSEAQRAKDWIFIAVVAACYDYNCRHPEPADYEKNDETVRDPDDNPDSIEWQTYIGTKIIKARPKARLITPGPDKTQGYMEPGYELMYPDGYLSWSPKAVFEEAYRPLNKDERIMAGQSPAESSIMEITDEGKCPDCDGRGWNGAPVDPDQCERCGGLGFLPIG